MLLISLLALASVQDVPAAAPAVPPTEMTLTVQALPKSFKQNPVIKLSFNGKGRANNCSVVQTSGSTGIDKAACSQASGNITVEPVEGQTPEPREMIIAFEAEAKG